jgi:hypothetical protein
VISEVTIVDPHHPLCGERLKLLSLTCARGAGFIAVALADGRRRLIRRSATDLDRSAVAEPDMPRISARILLPLARQVRRMLATSQEETSHAEMLPSDPLCAQPLDNGHPEAPATPAAVAGPAVAGSNPAGPAARPTGPAAAPVRGGRPC